MVRTPCLDPDVVAFAVDLPRSWKVRRWRGRWLGKWVLREAFSDLLPDRFRFRPKAPIEVGSGSTALARVVSEMVPERGFAVEQARVLATDGVRVRDREGLYYYRIYREVFGPPRPAGPGKECPDCHSTSPSPVAVYCRVCGGYPI